MEPGCGKTRVVIDFCGIKAEQGELNKVLVVAPKVACSVWKDEIDKFLPKRIPRRVLDLSEGPIVDRKYVVRNAWDVGILTFILINYDVIYKMKDVLSIWNPDLIVADESHFIKHHTSQRSRALFSLGNKARWKLILTGTPITNSALDIFSQFKFLNPNVFGTRWQSFKHRYAVWGGFGGYKLLRYKNLDDMAKRIHLWSYKAKKKDVLDLPPYTFQEVYIPLKPKTQRVYRQMEKDLVVELEDLGAKATASIALTKALRLLQITGGFVTDEEKQQVQVGSEKLDALREILTTYVVEGNSKVVIFANFIWELNQIAALCKKLKIDSINLRDVKDETAAKKRFLNDPDCKVFIMQISKGIGINELTAANIGIFYSLNYSSDSFIQARDRLHRPGQKRKVLYLVLLTKGGYDTKVYQNLRRNKSMADSIVDWKDIFKKEDTQ